MNVVEVEDMKVRAKKVPEWESKLWSYLSRGDGEHCPSYDRCRSKKEYPWCVVEHTIDIKQVLEQRRFNIAKCDFIKAEPERLCKPFRLVEMLAQKHLKRGKIHGLPVSVKLVSLLDVERPVELRQIPLKVSHGAIWCVDDRWIIQLSDRDIPAVRRFTLFHEAFHILAHCQGPPVFRKRGVERGHFNEELADYFAACILMPREWVKEKWVEVKDLDNMAKTFGVPKVVMWVRLRQLSLV